MGESEQRIQAGFRQFTTGHTGYKAELAEIYMTTCFYNVYIYIYMYIYICIYIYIIYIYEYMAISRLESGVFKDVPILPRGLKLFIYSRMCTYINIYLYIQYSTGPHFTFKDFGNGVSTYIYNHINYLYISIHIHSKNVCV